MGVSISGFATNANKKEVIRSLEKACQLVNPKVKISFTQKVFFEELIKRKEQDNVIDIYATSKGSILMFSQEILEKFSKWELSKFFDIDCFDISETSMSHRFAVFSGGKEIKCMNVWDNDSSREISGTNYLEIKDDEDIVFSVLPKVLDNYSEQAFHNIELNVEIDRYQLSFMEKNEEEQEELPALEDVFSSFFEKKMKKSGELAQDEDLKTKMPDVYEKFKKISEKKFPK